MVTKKQLRSSKKLKKRSRQKPTFPALLLQVVNDSDLVLQILDSRFVQETRNKEIEELILKQDKKILFVLNKSDLIKKAKIKKALTRDMHPNILVSAINRDGGKKLRDKIKTLAKQIEKKNDRERFSVGVIGYPNTGKSSIINLLIGKTSAKVGAKAGFTRGVQKLKLTQEILLIDSPGVIPREEYSNTDQEKMSLHTMVGARDYHRVKEPDVIVAQIVALDKKPFEKFYDLKIKDAEDFMEDLGIKKNILKKGGEVNIDQVARRIIRDWQEGKIKI